MKRSTLAHAVVRVVWSTLDRSGTIAIASSNASWLSTK
jgi:hypothetical protein